VLSSTPMLQLVTRQAFKRRSACLAAIIAMELATGLTVAPVDAAPRRHLLSRHGAKRDESGPRTRLDAAQRSPVPLPQPRPVGAPSPSPPSAAMLNGDQKQSSQKDDAAHEDEACLARLRAANVQFDIPATPAATKTACIIAVPVRLRSVATQVKTATEIRLPEEPIVSCQFAERLTAWLGSLVAPVIAGRTSVNLRAVRTGPGYECRNRNGAAVGKLSAHAVGQAIDISSFELSNGKSISVKPDGDEAMRNVVDSVRTAACGWFTTVLGPGADAAHADHLHVDMLQHGSSDRYRICQ
jgi:hypothetical protein